MVLKVAFSAAATRITSIPTYVNSTTVLLDKQTTILLQLLVAMYMVSSCNVIEALLSLPLSSVYLIILHCTIGVHPVL